MTGSQCSTYWERGYLKCYLVARQNANEGQKCKPRISMQMKASMQMRVWGLRPSFSGQAPVSPAGRADPGDGCSLLPSKLQRKDRAWRNPKWGCCPGLGHLWVLTALQGLLASWEYATGQHAGGGQALQCQHALALLSARHSQGSNFTLLMENKGLHGKHAAAERLCTSSGPSGPPFKPRIRHVCVHLYRSNAKRLRGPGHSALSSRVFSASPH